jgi:hypothetical protein
MLFDMGTNGLITAGFGITNQNATPLAPSPEIAFDQVPAGSVDTSPSVGAQVNRARQNLPPEPA